MGDAQLSVVRLRVRLVFFLASVLFFATALASTSLVEASHREWKILPAIDEGDDVPLTEYGWHYDEGDVWFGARDFNHPDDDEGILAMFRAKALKNLPWPFRYYRSEISGGCGMQAEAQLYSSGAWNTLNGTRLRYLHVSGVIPGPTGVMQYNGEEIYNVVGLIAYSGYGSGCVYGSPHVHQSADLEPGSTLNVRNNNNPDESCWVNSDIGQCPGTYTRDHVSCPNSYQTGSYSRSGTISEYICEEWSEKEFDPDITAVFYIDW